MRAAVTATGGGGGGGVSTFNIQLPITEVTAVDDPGFGA